MMIINTYSSIASKLQEQNSEPAHKIHPMQLSPDGNWLLYNKYDEQDINFPDCFLINTNTKKQYSFKNNSDYYKHLLKNDFLLGKNKDVLTINNLSDTTKTKRIPNIAKFDSNNNIVFTLSKNGELNIIELNKKNHILKYNKTNVQNFFLNEDKSILIFQENNPTKDLYYLNISNYKANFLYSPNQDISSLMWNLNQDCILFTKNNYILTYINLNTSSVQKIKLQEEEIEDLKIDFYANNDLFITYETTTGNLKPNSEFIDIWTSNNGAIFPSDFKPRFEKNYYAKLYNYTTGKLSNLNANSGKIYIPISIPGYVVFQTPLKDNQFLEVPPVTALYIQNINSNQTERLTSFEGTRLFISPDDQHMLYPLEKTNNWEVFTPHSGKKLVIEKASSDRHHPIWSKDSKFIYFTKDNNIVKIEVSTGKIIKLSNFTDKASINIAYNIQSSLKNKIFIDSERPILYSVIINNKTAIYKIVDNLSKVISPFTLNKITALSYKTIDANLQTLIWTEQNYNQPHTLYLYKDKRKSILVNTELPEETYKWQKQKIITFKDSKGVNLEGALFYPKDFNPNEKYAMVTFIYDKIWEYSATNPNTFVAATYYNQDGFNRALLNENNYFVFIPDTYVNSYGPGLSAIDCVENAIQSILEEEPSINAEKIGLIGGSFGAYKASMIASHSDRFSAIICNSGPYDLIGYFYYRLNLNFRHIPEYGRAEGGQYKMNQTFAENPQKYYDNSPLLHAHKIKTPILLSVGKKDVNVDWENTSTFYWALKRYKNTDFIALFYDKVGHAYDVTTEVSKDFTQRSLDWYDYYLKDNKKIKWINDGLDPNKSPFNL